MIGRVGDCDAQVPGSSSLLWIQITRAVDISPVAASEVGPKFEQIGPTIDAATGGGEGSVVREDDFDAAGKTDGDVVQERKQRGQR